MIMSSMALLEKNPKADDREIRKGIVGNLCRCTGYVKIVEAVKTSQEMMGEEESMIHKEPGRI
jgi:carbon-monoxide dehydrogenase small subunit